MSINLGWFLGLGGCSEKSVTTPNNDDSKAKGHQEFELEGIGTVLSSFFTMGHNFDIDFINPANHHNEANVTSGCFSSNASYFFDELVNGSVAQDSTTIAGNRIGEKDYELSITMNSESGTLMWNGDVTTHFHYDAAEKTWHMSSSITEDEAERSYSYCDPGATFDILMASLECYAANGGNAAAAVETLTKSIKAQRESILEDDLPLYSAEDCEDSIDSKTYAGRWDGISME